MLEEFATELLGLVLHALANVWPPGAKDVRGGARCSGEVGGGLRGDFEDVEGIGRNCSSDSSTDLCILKLRFL